ncbi:hypothetical protein pb186bvf_011917 [Paramecium bursaria]
MSNTDFTFSSACQITVQIMLGTSFLVLGFVTFSILYNIQIKPSSLISKALIEKNEQRSFVAPLFYFLVMVHSFVMCIYVWVYSAQGIKYFTEIANSSDPESIDRFQQRMIAAFNNGLYISDAIFLIIFIIMFSQMIIYNEYGHLVKGAQFQSNLLTKRTYTMPKEILITLLVYILIQVAIIITYNIVNKEKGDGFTSSIVLNSIDFAINACQPLSQIVYESYTNRRFQGCPIKSKKMEKQIRSLRSIIIFFSVGRAIQALINAFIIYSQKTILYTLIQQSGFGTYVMIAIYMIVQITFEIIPFIMTFSKEIQKILLKTFEQEKSLQLDQESPEIQLREHGSDESDMTKHRYTISDQNDRAIIELKINEFTLQDQFTQPSTSVIQFGILNRAKLTNNRYSGKLFICRRIPANRLSQYLIEEINQDIQSYRKLVCPYLIQIKAIHIDPDYIYFFLPYFDHQSLGQIILSQNNDGQQIDLETKFTFLKNICSGMQYLHDNNICHGQLKSNNILISKNNQARIVDFGLNALKKFVSLTTGYTTKSQFTSPELLQERSSTPLGTVEGDIYAFGMITWEVFHMKQAFPGLSIQDLTKLIATDQKRPKIDENIPDDMKMLIRACWQAEPQKRPRFSKIIQFLEGTLQNLE